MTEKKADVSVEDLERTLAEREERQEKLVDRWIDVRAKEGVDPDLRGILDTLVSSEQRHLQSQRQRLEFVKAREFVCGGKRHRGPVEWKEAKPPKDQASEGGRPWHGWVCQACGESVVQVDTSATSEDHCLHVHWGTWPDGSNGGPIEGMNAVFHVAWAHPTEGGAGDYTLEQPVFGFPARAHEHERDDE